LILRNLHDSQGDAVSVSDDEIIHSRRQMAQKEGIFCCPEGAATLAGLHKLINEGKVNRDETIVLFNTGSGMKYLDSTTL
jgi:threonine synthase